MQPWVWSQNSSPSLNFHRTSGWQQVSLFSLTAKVYQRFSHIQYFISLFSIYNLNSSKMSYGKVLPDPHKCQQVNSHLSSHSSYSNTAMLCFLLPGLYSGCVHVLATYFCHWLCLPHSGAGPMANNNTLPHPFLCFCLVFERDRDKERAS